MPRKPQPVPYDGALVIDKPPRQNSHDIVDAVPTIAVCAKSAILARSIACHRRARPAARKATARPFYTGRRKRYTAGFRFASHHTYDSEASRKARQSPA